MRALVAVDLDQTLLYTARTPAGHLLERLDPAVTRTLAALAARHVLLPVTTRTPEQYERVGLSAVLAVCANGGVLLRAGQPDAEWAEWVRGVCEAAAPVAEVAAAVGASIGPSAPWVRSTRVAAGLFVYVVAHRREDVPAEWLGGMGPWLAERGWVLSQQGRKVYAVPAGLSKAAAVARVRAELAAGAGVSPPLVAAGDSLLDGALLASADAAIRPAHGELHERAWTCPGLAVTRASGPAAAQEIAGWLLARADALTAPAATRSSR